MARPNSVVIPADDEVEPENANIAGTPDNEARANSLKLGGNAKGAPVGMPKTVRIILEETDNMAPTGAVFSLNGKAFLIRPGEEVDIPMGLKEVIDNAVMSVPIHDPQTTKVVGYRDRHRFPYRVVSN